MSLLDRVRARITFWNVLRVVGAVGFAAAVIWPPPTSAHVPHNPPAADIVVVQLRGAGRAPEQLVVRLGGAAEREHPIVRGVQRRRRGHEVLGLRGSG